eukprot:CAMPEP_0198525042 /NCGR_PEP_ID=MMETSP1462-20131121/23109_1 /TAXON_ID=1333877 /ORGANISM="Brandtodinium nutriculum, Strain RCC3387" /LENGTH=90 /DNA_ID=CAMNT_0044254785 /DNA_START=70 /DNA_END=339 /DNA_ORIENTATION=+
MPPSSGQGGLLRYTYDPRNPTTYAGAGWLNMRKDGPRSQRDVEMRSDVLVLTSEPFEHSFDVVGNVRATLFMRCSAPECDVVARLCVVRK